MTAPHICLSPSNKVDVDDIASFLSLDTPIAVARQTPSRPSSVALVFEAPGQHVWPIATELSRRLDTEKSLSRLLFLSGTCAVNLVSQRRTTRSVKSSAGGHWSAKSSTVARVEKRTWLAVAPLTDSTAADKRSISNS